MRIRVSHIPFWPFFWFLMPFHALVCLVPVINVIDVFCGGAEFETVKANVYGGSVYVGVCLLAFAVLYLVWRAKNPVVLFFDKTQGIVKINGKIAYQFKPSKVIIYREYLSFWEILLAGRIEFGKTTVTIRMDNDQALKYELRITAFSGNRLEKRLIKSHL